MLFNSYEFIFLFLPITVLGFFFVSKFWGRRAGMPWLTVASLCFYGHWDYAYVPLLLLSIIVNYSIGRTITNMGKPALILGITFDLALLGYFKYTDFFLGTINDLAGTELSLPNIVLPLGISFFTFTQIACLVDVYRQETKTTNFFSYLEFVTIFPHLIAGPIISHRAMQPQFMSEKTYCINWENVARGITLFSVGLFKKVCIADTISPWVSELFAKADSLNLIEAWLAAVGYTFQLYFDFSGYSEMAIGLALIINLRFPMNFDSPYKSLSIIDFWRRWHMTLGLWVKDYLYIPLGGNRHGEVKKMQNLPLSMLLIGLWHGAGWTFIFWGGLHGVFLVINHQWRRLGIALPKILSWGLTFLAVVCAWVFFRAENLSIASSILLSMVDIKHIVLPANGAWEHYFGFLNGSLLHFMPWGHPFSLMKQLTFLLACFVLIIALKNPVRVVQNMRMNIKTSFVVAILLFGTIIYTRL